MRYTGIGRSCDVIHVVLRIKIIVSVVKRFVPVLVGDKIITEIVVLPNLDLGSGTWVAKLPKYHIN